jgi:hypothetical protein
MQRGNPGGMGIKDNGARRKAQGFKSVRTVSI